MQMALYGALRFLHQCRRLAHAETLQMHQYKSFLLAATELRQRLGDASPEQGIASSRNRSRARYALKNASWVTSSAAASSPPTSRHARLRACSRCEPTNKRK